jgi:hypothetical protein
MEISAAVMVARVAVWDRKTEVVWAGGERRAMEAML